MVPLLFNLYLDILLKRLKDSGVGCHIGNLYVGSLAYADDLVLLCPTIHALNVMLRICESYACEFDISFNASKSKLITYNNTGNVTANVYLQGHMIPQTMHEKHVGILVGCETNVNAKRVQSMVNEMYGKVNLLISQFSKCSHNVRLTLFKMYCTSFYGSQLLNFSCITDLNKLYVAYRKCLRRVLKVPCNTHCNILYAISGL